MTWNHHRHYIKKYCQKLRLIVLQYDNWEGIKEQPLFSTLPASTKVMPIVWQVWVLHSPRERVENTCILQTIFLILGFQVALNKVNCSYFYPWKSLKGWQLHVGYFYFALGNKTVIAKNQTIKHGTKQIIVCNFKSKRQGRGISRDHNHNHPLLFIFSSYSKEIGNNWSFNYFFFF